MSQPDPSFMDGRAQFPLLPAGKPCETWYRVYGDLKSGPTPLIVLHGGPGSTWDYLGSIADLTKLYARPVIFYDQLGNGQSTHLPEKKGDTSFWTEKLFLDELDNLLIHLGIGDEYDILGQSWGGMLASRHASWRPKGLRRLIIESSPADMKLWVEAADKLREKLPKEVQATLLKHEGAGTTDSKEYEDAMNVFYEKHLCRMKPWPEGLQKAMKIMEGDPTVYHTMNGPSEFHITGSLKDWSIVEDCRNIDVPTLLINGHHDEAQDSCIYPFFKNIPRVRWVTLANSSHCSHDEEREKFMEIVESFLSD